MALNQILNSSQVVDYLIINETGDLGTGNRKKCDKLSRSPVFRKLIINRCNDLIFKYTFSNLGAANAFLWYLSERTKIEVAATVSRLSPRQGVTIGL